MIAQDVTGQMEAAGVTVLGPAPSVAKALRLIEGARLDAAVLDVNLGQENSFPIAHALEAKGIPFLFSTGYNSGDIPAEWGHVTVALKPLRIGAVAEMLVNDGAR